MTSGSVSKTVSASRRRRRFDRRTTRYLLLFVAGALVLNALLGERGLLETLTANRLHAELSDRIISLRQENESLREEVRRLREEPTTIEEIARRDLGLIKEGERLFIVSEDSSRR